MVNAQEWLDRNYPQEMRNEIIELDIRNKNLEGCLTLEKFVNLKKLDCSNNQIIKISIVDLPSLSYFKAYHCRLISINIKGCPEIEYFHVGNNYLTNLGFLGNFNTKKLNFLSLNDNNFYSTLKFFGNFANLESLHLGSVNHKKIEVGIYNRFYGSLEPINNLVKLKYLDIRCTNIDSGLEFLPSNLKKIAARSINILKNPGCLKVNDQLEWFVKEDGEKESYEKLWKMEEGEPQWSENWSRTMFWKEVGGKKKLEIKEMAEVLFNQREREIEQKTDIWSKSKLLLNLLKEKELKMKSLCKECGGYNTSMDGYTGSVWCQPCSAKHFQENFNKWTSGNKKIDKFIQKHQLMAMSKYDVLEWLPYEEFKDIEHIGDGGFCTVFKAKWISGLIDHWNIKTKRWERDNNWDRGSWERGKKWVALKSINGSSEEINDKFLEEISCHKLAGGGCVVRCFGISRSTITGNYLIVTDYMKEGELRKFLDNNNQTLSFDERMRCLSHIQKGLSEIHERGLIHKDFHSGNIMRDHNGFHYITDLGLCRPANEGDDGKIYGVLPYVAPEVLRGKPYTQASDVYSFGIIMYEVITGLPPYHGIAHNQDLASRICQGLRPNLDVVKIPQLLRELIVECWDANPSGRPDEHRLLQLIKWAGGGSVLKNTETEFYRQFREIEEEVNNSILSLSISKRYNHPQAVYYSKRLDFRNLPQPQNSKEINDQFYKKDNNSKVFDPEQIKELENLKGSLGIELLKLADGFIQSRKIMIKDKKNKEVRSKVKELEKELKKNGMSKEKIEEIIRHCEKIVNLEQKVEKEEFRTQIELLHAKE